MIKNTKKSFKDKQEMIQRMDQIRAKVPGASSEDIDRDVEDAAQAVRRKKRA